MTMQIVTNSPTSEITTPRAGFQSDTTWRQYFSIPHAIASVQAHIETLPGSARERHTARAYEYGLSYFLQWSHDQLPTPDLVTAFIAHLRQPCEDAPNGRAASTIAAKFLAPLRLYLRKLAAQHVPGVSGPTREYVEDCRLQIRNAADVKNPRPAESSNLSPLYRTGNRLSLSQINDVFASCDQSTLAGMRDLAFLYWGFTTGMRVAELSRVTQNSVQPGANTYEVIIRGKRGNIDPVPVDAEAVRLLNAWVDAYNEGLSPDDPRYIGPDTPVWKPLTRYGRRYHADDKRVRPDAAMSENSLRGLVIRRSRAAIGRAIKPHDMRRTVAALARENGMDYDKIRVLLRHKSIATTARYVGDPQNLSQSMITNYVQFTV